MVFPKFKKKGQKDSYREYLTNNNIAVILEESTEQAASVKQEAPRSLVAG
jgi:hypothetical protein